MHSTKRQAATLAVAIGLCLGVENADAAARIGPHLSNSLSSALPTQQFEVVISFAQTAPLNDAQRAALKSLGLNRGLTFHALPIAGGLATPAVIQRLAQRNDVLSVVANRELRYYNADARQQSGVDRLQADSTLGYTGRGVSVMINDSGIDANHGDLAYGERVVENVQALTNLNSLFSFMPVSYLEGQLNTDISSGHGTHCAGTVGGSGAQSNGVQRGVAPNADLIGYGSGAVVSILDALGGFDYAIAHRDDFAAPIKVISNSWGTSGDFEPSDPVNIASYAAYTQGIVSVFAAGNDGPSNDTHNPYAQAPWVISVGAANKDRSLADFSSRGNPGESASFSMPDGSQWTYVNQPTLVATGVDIVSTRALTGALPLLASSQDLSLGIAQFPYYTHMSGTSMSTPHVAGIAALMFEANPGLQPDEVKAILSASADAMPGRSPHEVGAGHVDAFEAVSIARGL